MRVADKIAEFLHEKGIRHVFGIIGAGNVCIFDAIANHGKIQIVPFHHEQAAVMAATYYYRVSERLAPVVITTGAGSSNAITGVLAAWMDSIPVLVISGNEAAHFFQRPNPRVAGVQGYHSAGLVKDITKIADQVRVPAHALISLSDCYRSALAPRQGPCWVDICQDVQRAEI